MALEWIGLLPAPPIKNSSMEYMIPTRNPPPPFIGEKNMPLIKFLKKVRPSKKSLLPKHVLYDPAEGGKKGERGEGAIQKLRNVSILVNFYPLTPL